MTGTITRKYTSDAALLHMKKEGGKEQLFVLLVRRAWEPFQGKWALPGGHRDLIDGVLEDAESAARRELMEETTVVAPQVLIQLGEYDRTGRDPRGDYHTTAFTAMTETMMTPFAGDDAAEARWVPVTAKLLDEDLAFDHAMIIGDALEFYGFPVPTPASERVDQLRRERNRALRGARWSRDLGEIGLLMLTVLSGYLIVFSGLHPWLPAGAAEGSPRHWVLGTVAIALLMVSFSGGHRMLFSEDHRLPTRSYLAHGALAALLLWPLFSQLAMAWQVNDAALVPQLGKALLIQLSPLLIVHLTQFVLAYAVGGLFASAENHVHLLDEQLAAYDTKPGQLPTSTS